MEKLYLMGGLLVAVLALQATAEAARGECFFGSRITSDQKTSDGKRLIGIHVFVAHKNGNNTEKDVSEKFDDEPLKKLLQKIKDFTKNEEKQSCKDNNCD